MKYVTSHDLLPEPALDPILGKRQIAKLVGLSVVTIDRLRACQEFPSLSSFPPGVSAGATPQFTSGFRHASHN